SRRPTQTCLCWGTGVSSATPRAPLRADCRGPALAVGPAAERWAGRVVLVATSETREQFSYDFCSCVGSGMPAWRPDRPYGARSRDGSQGGSYLHRLADRVE